MEHLPTRLLFGLVAVVLPLSVRAQDAGRAAGNRSTLVQVDFAAIPALGRTIALDLQNVSMDVALQTIARKAALPLTYSRELLPENRKVSLTARRIEVDEALRAVLRGAGLDILALSSGQVVVVRKRLGEIDIQGELTGRVTDANTGTVVAGAEVFLENTRWRTATDTGGRYRFADVDTGTYTLTVRRLGFAKQSRQVTVHADRENTLDVALKPVAARLNDLVTTATGLQRRRDLGNAVTTIQADSVLQTAPIRNLTDLLQGRVPGLTIRHTSGAPGDPARLRLRGIGSAMLSNDPVVIVDGVRIYSAQTGLRSGNLTNLANANGDKDWAPGGNPAGIRPGSDILPAPSPLDQIDPNIIEKIEVFKGPSAATLYGADAANGVIVITTKKGRPGPARWTASLSHGITNTLKGYPEGYFRWGHPQFVSGTKFCTILDPDCVQDSLVRYQALNDPKFTVLGQGHGTAGSLTVSGGSSTLTYSLTGTYADDVGLLRLPDFEVDRFRTLVGREAPDWMRRPHHLTKWSATSTVRALLGTAADVTLTTTLTREEQQRSSLEQRVAGLTGTYVDQVAGAYYVPRTGTAVGALALTTNILQDYYTRATASALNLATGVSASWHPRPWFSGSSQLGLNVVPRQDELFSPVGVPGFGSDSGILTRGTGRALESTFNLQGLVRKPIGRGFEFVTSVGVNLSNQRTDDQVGAATGLRAGTSAQAGAAHYTIVDNQENRSVFGYWVEPRVSGQRFSLSTGLRLDGGSAYGARITRQSGGLFGLLSLPKLNGSWTISEEPWFPFKGVFSSLRLRGAYGQAQVQPGAGERLRLYGQTPVEQDYLLTQLGNTQLRPERDGELEGGFDADLLDSRLSLEVTSSRKTSIDALMPLTLPLSVNGGGSVLINIGNIRNRTTEVTLRATPLRQPAATWTMELNYTRLSNLLTKLGRGVQANPQQGLVAGYPVGSRWDRPIVGFADQNGDGVLQPGEIQFGDSAAYLGRLLPKHTSSLNTSLAILGGAVTVSAALNYESGATQVNDPALSNWVLTRALVDPATPLAEQAPVLAGSYAGLGRSGTIAGVASEVSTWRFQSLSVNYRAPAAVARLVRAQELSVAVQADNLGLHTSYSGTDPDVTGWTPNERVVDVGQLAQPRLWQLRVNVRY